MSIRGLVMSGTAESHPVANNKARPTDIFLIAHTAGVTRQSCFFNLVRSGPGRSPILNLDEVAFGIGHVLKRQQSRTGHFPAHNLPDL